jgi:predicted transcriptional regulator
VVIEISGAIYPVSSSKYTSPEKLEALQELIEVLNQPKNTDAERIKYLFDLIDEELLTEYESNAITLEKVNLERTYLTGLNNRRSEMEILAHILNIARGSAKKTKILYQANLSGRQLKNYLTFLLGAGFIKEQKITRRTYSYSTTKKGNLFLFHWIKILSLLETNPSDVNTAP